MSNSITPRDAETQQLVKLFIKIYGHNPQIFSREWCATKLLWAEFKSLQEKV